MRWLVTGAIFVLLATAVAFIIFSERYHLPEYVEKRGVDIVAEIKVADGSVQQGILVADSRQQTADSRQQTAAYYSSNHPEIIKFDSQWNVLERKRIFFDGISNPHIGILSFERGHLLAGVIDLDAYEMFRKNTRIALIDAVDLVVKKVYDFSPHSRYIDAVVKYDDEYWVSYNNVVSTYHDTGRGALKLKRRYKILTGTAQGIRIRGGYLYVVAENNLTRARGLPNGIYQYSLDKLIPYERTITGDVLLWIESLLSSLNYRTPLPLFNRFINIGMNFPIAVWEFGFPIENPDNEGFSFDGSSPNIWISDAIGNTARKILLH